MKKKPNLRILIVTLCLSLALVVAGIVTGSGTGSVTGGSTGSTSIKVPAIKVREQADWYGTAANGKTLVFEFTPDVSDYYYIKADSLEIKSIQSSDGTSVGLGYEYNNWCDECRGAYLTGGKTYYITVITAGSHQWLFITDTN